MNRRDFAKAGVAATIATGFNLEAQTKGKRPKPNILYLFGDEHRAIVIGTFRNGGNASR